MNMMAYPKSMSPYQQYIHMSRYSRWNDDLNRRESWDETVDRYIAFFTKHLTDNYPKAARHFAKSGLWAELRDGIYNLETMPSMRALMTAGPALENDNLAGYNCFSGDTQFATSEGIFRLDDFASGTEVMVLGEHGYVPATVRKFGKKKLYRLTVQRAKHIEEIYTTLDHRWLTVVNNGTGSLRGERTTQQLMPGDVLKKYTSNKIKTIQRQCKPCNVGIMHGMVFGDGTKHRDTTRIVLCSDSVQFADLFTTGSKGEVRGTGSKAKQYIGGLPYNWKELPKLDEVNPAYLLGFVMGWFAADGRIGKTGTSVDVGSSSYDTLTWLRGALAKLGIFTRPIKGGPRPNPFNPEKTSYMYYLCLFTDNLDSSFFLKAEHRRRFEARANTGYQQDWKVVSVEDSGRTETVWCVQEPENEIFTLANGIQTRNCAHCFMDHTRAFSEILYVLMNGTGMGFSVERQYINRLPIIGAKVVQDSDGEPVIQTVEQLTKVDYTIVVRDSKLGWAQAYHELITHLYDGKIPKWDTSKVRPKGAKLKTFGGRASGPEPLIDLFEFTISRFKAACGRKLNSLEVHDIVCKIADVVVCGGVRRSALISLSNLSDDRMRNAKNGNFGATDPQRYLANNSVAYTERPEFDSFLREWVNLYESRSGERGIFNRVAAKRRAASSGRRSASHDFGINPCAEVILRNCGLCNLTEIVARPEDTVASLKKKARLASILGTLQSTLTNFKYVRPIWAKNAEEERLLGVSLTGIMDSKLLNGSAPDQTAKALRQLKQIVLETNQEFAKLLGINPSVATTVVKPSGTVSQLVNSSSGIHPGYSQYYIRRVRNDIKDPVAQYMIAAGVPNELDVTNSNSVIFSFPMRSAPGSVLRDETTALGQLELYKLYQENWTEHNVSITVYYKDNEFLDLGSWVYKNWDDVCGVSMLPHSDHIYRQAPYEEITKAEYDQLVKQIPKLDWDKLMEFEKEDSTTNTKELACVSGVCEI